MTHPLAALIAGVPRHTIRCYVDDMPCLLEKDVLAALEAAPVPDLVEAGKVEANLRNEATIATRTEAADNIRALIALATAQAAQIAGLEQHVADLMADQDCACGYDRPDDVCTGHMPLHRRTMARAEAAETALAAERAKVARIAAAWPLCRDTNCTGGELASAIDEIDDALEGKA